jgi:aminopeptidase N
MLENSNKKTRKIFVLVFTIFIAVTLPVTIACGSSDISGAELPYGQSSALQVIETERVSKLPDITHYNLKVTIDMEKASYSGSAVIDYTNLEDRELSSLFLRLLPNGGGTYGNGRLEVGNLTVNGSSTEVKYSLDDSVLEIILDEILEAGAHLAIKFDFEGIVPVDFDGGGYGIFNLSNDVMSLAGWYPILAVYDDEGWNIDPVYPIGDSVYSDIAYYTVEITLPDDMGHAATGSMIGEISDSGSTKYSYVSGPVRDFFIITGNDFKVKTKKMQGIDVNVYYLDGHEKAADMTLRIAKGSLKTFNDKFGTYPYDELDIIDAPMNGSIAVEFPGIVVVGSQIFGNAVFTSHEIAHQWWYNVVGNDVIDDPWLDEALTTYSSIIYYEFSRSGIEYGQVLDYFEAEYENTQASGNDDTITQGLDYFEKLGGRHYSTIVYTKGAIFYHQLRMEIGDKAFFTALKDYYSDLKYGIASNEDILDRFEEFSGRNLDSFYQEWLY